MKLGTIFILSALAFGACAVRWQGPAWGLLAVAASLILVGLAYLGLGPAVFGKRADGTLSPWSIVLLLPYLSYVWGVWRLLRLVRSVSAFDDLAPGIIIGRRLFPAEYPPDVEHVLDLTCEFPEFSEVRRAKDYQHFPILDGYVPRLNDLLRLLGELDRITGTLYIHCAEGHGRTGLVAAAILLSRGVALDADQAVGMVRAKRRRVRLKACQRKMLTEVARSVKTDARFDDTQR